MGAVLRSLFVYVFLLIILRISGKRTLAETSTFDFVLLLIISEAIQEALLAGDNSIINSVVIVATLISMELVFSLIKQKSKILSQWLEGNPLLIVNDGRILHDRLGKELIDEEDILEAARRLHGLESLAEVKYAVLEKSGGITIIPQREKRHA